MDILFVILNVVLLQVDNCKFVLRFQVGSFYQVEDLHPMSVVEAVFSKIFDELDDDVCLVDLLVDGFTDFLTLALDEFMLR
jgi:hypothetical protein